MFMTIYFDMDGTIADLYGVENWLDYLINSDATPYKVAKPLINLNSLARVLNNKQKKGVKIGVISWLSKNGSDEYNELVTRVKIEWLKKHLKSVNFDEVHIVKYGTPKVQFKKNRADVLFDDECGNRAEWGENAFDVNDIIEILKGM
jgi:hypothetical protein